MITRRKPETAQETHDAEVACNLAGKDPNNEEHWQEALAEVRAKALAEGGLITRPQISQIELALENCETLLKALDAPEHLADVRAALETLNEIALAQ